MRRGRKRERLGQQQKERERKKLRGRETWVATERERERERDVQLLAGHIWKQHVSLQEQGREAGSRGRPMFPFKVLCF